MERDILVELNDAVQRCPASERDECPANREENQSDIDVQNQRRRASYYESRAKGVARYLQVVLERIVDACEGENEPVKENEHEDEAAMRVSKVSPQHNEL